MHSPLQVESVVKTFQQGEKTIRALDGIDFTVAAGEFVVVMGASGSGKSTLLHAMAGLTDVDAGRVLVEDQDLAVLSDAKLTTFRRRRIGLVFQAFNLIPVLSAEDNIRLPAPNTPGLDAKVDSLLERLGLKDRRSHKPDKLSGGEQQRVAIARALITDPAILLADEPTGSLDSVAGQELCKLLKNLCAEEKRTIVIVTHEPNVAIWGSRAVILKDGQNIGGFPVAECDGPLDLAARYQEALRGAKQSQPTGVGV